MKRVTPHDAAHLIHDRDSLWIGGSGAGHAVPQGFIEALAQRFATTGQPRGLTTIRVVGIGDFAEVGMSQLALPGLQSRTITSNIGNEPRLAAMVRANELEAYSFPQGVLAALTREMAAGPRGLVTDVGLGTYVDPRNGGGRQNDATAEDLVQVIELAGKEWLFYPTLPIDVAVIRASTADEDGNLTMEDEAVHGDSLALAMAAHNNGGIVIAQVAHLAQRHSLRPRDVRIPGALIDYVMVQEHPRQTYATEYSPYFAGLLRQPDPVPEQEAELSVRDVIARRSLLEFRPGDICNLGYGISQSIGHIAALEGVTGDLTLTVEQGIFGGTPAGGADGGAGVNFQAMLEQPSMFDFYDGGGLDVASLSFAQVDAEGNVNVHDFGDLPRGPGGFINIANRTGRLIFVGTLTTRGLSTSIEDGHLRILREGAEQKFVPKVRQTTFSGPRALAKGQQVTYVTERAVFSLEADGLVLTEIAEGLDLERDVLAHLGFRPRIAQRVSPIDPRVFRAGPMGLAATFRGSAVTALVDVVLGTRCELSLNDPPMNLVSHEMTLQLRAALHRIAAHDEARVLVVSSAGERSFCAGSDVAEFEHLRGSAAEGKMLLEKLVFRQLATLPIPTVAAVEGHALGGGLELAMCCDLRIVSEQSKLGLPELKLGVIPGSGGTQRLARLVGLGRAKELILLGELISASEAERIGLANRVAPRAAALETARSIADEIASRGPIATRLAKRLIDASMDQPLDEGLARELEASEVVFDSEDMLEGAAAFRAKRAPRFRGR